MMFLDTDLGQPVFGVPGTVSLYRFSTKNWFLTNLGNQESDIEVKPLESYFIGEFSPTINIQMYFNAIVYIMKLYNDNFA